MHDAKTSRQDWVDQPSKRTSRHLKHAEMPSCREAMYPIEHCFAPSAPYRQLSKNVSKESATAFLYCSAPEQASLLSQFFPDATTPGIARNMGLEAQFLQPVAMGVAKSQLLSCSSRQCLKSVRDELYPVPKIKAADSASQGAQTAILANLKAQSTQLLREAKRLEEPLLIKQALPWVSPAVQ